MMGDACSKMCLYKLGRNPKGYGLPSLVVVLFFVSVVVTTIINITTRENLQSRAEANYLLAKEHISAFKSTGLAGEAVFPHIIETSELEVNLGTDLTFNIDTGAGYSDALWASKVRGYINAPMESGPLGAITEDEMPRKYPERVLREGDRMATNLESENVGNVQLVTTGQGSANFMRTSRMLGIDTTFISSPELQADRVEIDAIDMTSRLTTQEMTISGSMVTRNVLTRNDMTVNGFLSAQTSQIEDVDVTHNFATDSLDNSDTIAFSTLNANGLRTDRLQQDPGNTLQYGDGSTVDLGGGNDNGGEDNVPWLCTAYGLYCPPGYVGGGGGVSLFGN